MSPKIIFVIYLDSKYNQNISWIGKPNINNDICVIINEYIRYLVCFDNSYNVSSNTYIKRNENNI